MELLKGKKTLCAFLFLAVSLVCARAQGALALGCAAYSDGEWGSAALFFKRAQAMGGLTDEAWYMLVRSEMQLGDDRAAQADCERFVVLRAESEYAPYMMYLNGALLHRLGQNERAVSSLCEFCRENPGSFLYADALYVMAESFFDECNFGAAKALYEKIVFDFPLSGNVQDAKCKILLIKGREREEKLLYLLKISMEESLSAREEHDRQMKALRLEGAAQSKRPGQGQ